MHLLCSFIIHYLEGAVLVQRFSAERSFHSYIEGKKETKDEHCKIQRKWLRGQRAEGGGQRAFLSKPLDLIDLSTS